MPSERSRMVLAHPNIYIIGRPFATPTPLLFFTRPSKTLYNDSVKLYIKAKTVREAGLAAVTCYKAPQYCKHAGKELACLLIYNGTTYA